MPFIRFPQYEDVVEENWFFASLVETYLPMVFVLDTLVREKVPCHCSWIISPTLVTMADDALLEKRFLRYFGKLFSLLAQEKERCKNFPEFLTVIEFYENKFQNALDTLNRFQGSFLAALQHLVQCGAIELIPTAATSAFLPLYRSSPQVVRAQIACGLANFREKFDCDAKGFWLPYCGYYPELENYLQEYGLEYTFLPTQSLKKSPTDPDPLNVVRSPQGFQFFPVSHTLVEKIFDQQHGYPTHPVYRNFYRDIAFDLPLEIIGDYALHHDERVATGLRYMANTGPTEQKDVYNPLAAKKQAELHAADFVTSLLYKRHSFEKNDHPIITCVLDMEFFGHWWLEGIPFLEHTLRIIAQNPKLNASTPGTNSIKIKKCPVVQPSFASWGVESYAQIWLNDKNDWLIRHLYVAVKRMTELAQRFQHCSPLQERLLNQAAKEVLLALSSDWPILLYHGSNTAFALEQIRVHLANFNKLYHNLSANMVYIDWFINLEKQNNPFLGKDFSYKLFAQKDFPSV